MQFGGQTLVSIHYEYSILVKQYFILNTNIGLGQNEYADDTDPNDRPISGIHSGLICLLGTDPISVELGLNPTTYFYKSTTFVNLNGWTGIRYSPKYENGFFIAVGYTPRFYYTYSDPNNKFLNVKIGVKLGVCF